MIIINSIFKYSILVLVIISTTSIIVIVCENESENKEFLKKRFAQYTKEYLDEFYSKTLMEINDQIIEHHKNDSSLVGMYKWNTDENELTRLLDDLMAMLYTTYQVNSRFYKSQACWDLILGMISLIYSQLDLKPRVNAFPWGNNWFQFSITLPRFLVFAHYIHYVTFNEFNLHLEELVVHYVPAYIENPRTSLGWKRYFANSIMMSIPYVGAYIAMDKYHEIIDSSDMQYIIELSKLEPTQMGEGIYADGGYVFHEQLRAFGYINEVYLELKLLKKLTGIGDFTLLEKLQKILEHPTINLHFGPLFGRTSKLSSNIQGDYGFHSIDSLKVVSVKEKNWMLQFFGQLKHLCFYEADQSNFLYPQYWVFVRQLYYANTENFIRPELIPYYPGVITLNNKAISMRSKMATTQTFTPEKGDSIIVNAGDMIGMRNAYTIQEFNLSVIEMMLITGDGYSVVYDVKNTSPSDRTPIKVTVNLGNLETEKQTDKVFKFENNYSIINICDNFTLTKVTNVSNSTSQQTALQCEPNDRNLVAFSTIHSSTNPFASSSEITINKIATINNITLKYEDLHLYLINKNKKQITIAKSQPFPAVHIDFDATLLKKNYPLVNPHTAQLINGTVYRDNVDFKRAYTTFSYT